EIFPNNVTAWNNKGLAFHRLGKYEEAIKCYDKALEIDPNYVTAWNNKGYTLDKLGKYKEAIKWYDKALKTDPKYVTAWDDKGLVPNARLSSALYLEDDRYFKTPEIIIPERNKLKILIPAVIVIVAGLIIVFILPD